jgi:hypothetical protein
MQAIAIQNDEDVVGVYAGMFWMLCRLAAVVAASGVFPAMKGDVEPDWRPEIGRSIQTPRHLLEEGVPFDWAMESIGWKEAPDRQILFYAVLTLSFRFVVFHELGHVVNDHCRRRTAANMGALLVDRPGPRLVAPELGVPSQAREIIADGFALMRTIESFDKELSNGGHLELAQVIRERLAPDDLSLIRFVLSVIFIYFRVSDRSDWQTLPIDQLTHPPAPFRMKALLALLYDNKPLGIDEETASGIIRDTMTGGDALMSVMFNIFPQRHWFEQISKPVHDRHFTRIYEECPKWSGRLPTAYSPDRSSSADPD